MQIMERREQAGGIKLPDDDPILSHPVAVARAARDPPHLHKKTPGPLGAGAWY